MLNLPRMSCGGNNEVTKICIDQRCAQASFMCGFPRCKCSEIHKLCKGSYQYQPLLTQLLQKTATLRKPLDNLIFWYANISKQVNMERDQLIKKIDILTEKLLDDNQAKFFQAVQEGKAWKVNGETMAKIILSLKKPLVANNVLEEQVKSEVNKVNKDLQDHLVKLRNIWDSDKDDKQSLEKLKKCGIRWTWLNGKWIKPVPDQFPLSDLTGLGLDFLDPTITKILASNCPKLEGLQVGYWVTNSNFDDTCAEVVAEYLPHLKRLWVYNSPLTDKGSISISNSLKALEYLILNNCKLTAIGKSEVRRLLPECKKIQLL